MVWRLVVATAVLGLVDPMQAQIRLVPDPVPDTAKETPKEVPTAPTAPERLAPPAPPAAPARPPTQAPDAPSDPTSPKTGGTDPVMSPTDGPANVPDLIELTGDEAFVPDALAADTLSRVEGELRKLLKVSATEPGGCGCGNRSPPAG